jgi:hypothetical protein
MANKTSRTESISMSHHTLDSREVKLKTRKANRPPAARGGPVPRRPRKCLAKLGGFGLRPVAAPYGRHISEGFFLTIDPSRIYFGRVEETENFFDRQNGTEKISGPARAAAPI